MGPKTHIGVLLAAAILAGDLGGSRPREQHPRKRSQKGRKRGFKAHQKKGHK